MGLFDSLKENFDYFKVSCELKKDELESDFKYSKVGMALSNISDTCKDIANKPAEVVAKTRNAIEDKATEINPKLGKVVDATLNVPSTIVNTGKEIYKEVYKEESNRIFNPPSDMRTPNLSYRIKTVEDEENTNSTHIYSENDFSLADHLYCCRVGYSHHGLYIGNGEVMHYRDGMICETTLEDFARGDEIRVMPRVLSPMLYSVDEVISRAYYAMGEQKYNVVINNCEHFVKWCRSGGDLFNRTDREY